MMVAPDTSNCSKDSVSPNTDYICSGLELDTSYNITVSAINCGDQLGNDVSFNVLTQFSGTYIIIKYLSE